MGVVNDKIDPPTDDGAVGNTTGSDESNIGDAGPVCPPHTTASKLMWRIDLHVVPFLCIMYLLAFLGMLMAQNTDHPARR